MTGRLKLGLAVIGIVVAGALVLLSAGRVWSRATSPALGSLGRTHLSVTGHQVAPSLSALGLAAMALAAAVLAARGWLRRVVGVLVVFVGALTIGVSVTARGDVSSALEHREVGAQGIPVHASANGWWVLALAGAVVVAVLGALTTARGEGWAALGARYDAPTAPQPRAVDPDVEAWRALDRGEDPTA